MPGSWPGTGSVLQYFGQGLRPAPPRPAHLPQDRKFVPCARGGGGEDGPPTWCGTESLQLELQFLPRDPAGTWEEGGRGKRWDERGRDTVRSRDTSCDTIPEVRGNVSGAGGLGAVSGGMFSAGAESLLHQARCADLGPGPRGVKQNRGGAGRRWSRCTARVPVWRRVPGSGRPAWSVRRTTPLRNPPHRVGDRASAGPALSV